MQREAFIRKWKETMYYMNHDSFETDLDELLKQHAIEAMKAFVPNLEIEDYEDCYNEWIRPE